MAFIFPLWKSLCYVMDLKLIDVINVSYMLYRSILLQILPVFSKWKTEKQRIVDFDGKCRPGLLYGDGVRMPKYLTIYYSSTGSLHENMRICQGNLGEFSGKNFPTSIAINQLAVKITRRSLSFGCICINSSTCIVSYNGMYGKWAELRCLPHSQFRQWSW